LVLPTPSPEVADHAAQGVVGVAGLLGDLLQRAPLDEIGAERFIAAVERVGGFEEEAQAGCIVHDLAPTMSVDFRWILGP
jgi:hypothetical protein